MALAAVAPLASDLPALAQSFRRMLRARNRSPRTVEGYLSGVERFIDFLARERLPMTAAEVRRADIEAFVAERVGRHKPNTAAMRCGAVQQFMRWLTEEGEITQNPMSGMRAPMVPDAPPPILPDDEIRAMLRACEGADLFARRDAALIRLLADTAMRAAKIVGLRVEDIDLDTASAFVLHAKMRRPRVVPFGSKMSAALDRYLRVRATHRDAAARALARPQGCADHKRRASGAGDPRAAGRRRARIPTPLPAQLRRRLPSRRRERAGPGAPRRLAFDGDASALCRIRGRRARSSCASAPRHRRPTVSKRVLRAPKPDAEWLERKRLFVSIVERTDARPRVTGAKARAALALDALLEGNDGPAETLLALLLAIRTMIRAYVAAEPALAEFAYPAGRIVMPKTGARSCCRS